MELSDVQLKAIVAALEQAQHVTPLGVVGYSFAVLVLLVLGWLMYTSWKKAESEVTRLAEKMVQTQEKFLEFMIKVDLRMNDQQDFAPKIDDIHRMVRDMKDQIQEVRDIIKRNG